MSSKAQAGCSRRWLFAVCFMAALRRDESGAAAIGLGTIVGWVLVPAGAAPAVASFLQAEKSTTC
ncbi:MAG: hypothetical protein ABI767_13495 [Rhodanobacter sp.]